MARSSLTTIAKIIEKLASGLNFGPKEPHMLPLNDLIEEMRPRVIEYMDEVIKVDGPDSYLSKTMSGLHTHITITPNELINLHALLHQHLSSVCREGDLLDSVMELLEEPPPPLPQEENKF